MTSTPNAERMLLCTIRECKLKPRSRADPALLCRSRTLKIATAQPTLAGLLISSLLLTYMAGGGRRALPVRVADLTRSIPARNDQDLTGSQFARYVSELSPHERESAILSEILKGNIPEFLRTFVPVELRYHLPSGENLVATVFVAPDYLAIGSDGDFLRIPMNLHTAAAIADRFGFLLPTKKMVDAIYAQSQFHLVPQPLPAGPQMRSTNYYWTHNEMVEEQARRLGVRLGDLISGQKKDVVMTNLLASRIGRIAIYGWHRGPGEPIQPLSTVHGANYADYSHGIRLVSSIAVIGGQLRSIYDILEDPSQARVLSDEGPIRNIRQILPSEQGLGD